MRLKYGCRQIGALVILMLLVNGTAQDVEAQWSQRWLDVGDFQDAFEGSGASGGGSGGGRQWPAIYEGTSHSRGDAVWIAAKGFTDEEGVFWDTKIAHSGPLVTGVGEVFTEDIELISKFDRPVVTVDGLETFHKPVVVDAVDPSIPSDRMVHVVVNSVNGITMDKKVMAFAQEHHDDYLVYDVRLVNTGNVDEDPEIELPDQTLEGVYLWVFRRYSINFQGTRMQGSGPVWGRYNMSDVIGFGEEDFEPEFGPDVRGYFTWGGHNRGFTVWDALGAPALDDSRSEIPAGDSVGRITASSFIGQVVVHADMSAGIESDDRSQPSTLHRIDNDGDLILGNDHRNQAAMIEEYNRVVEAGHEIPHHADLVEPPQPGVSWRERMAFSTADPSLGVTAGGWSETMSFGPYTLAPGEDVRFVWAEGAGGLSRDASIQIGKAYKRAHETGNEHAPIEYDANGNGTIEPDEEMSKNEWVMTGRDSIFQTFRRFQANYESGYSIPHAPLPPREFHVTSSNDRILLNWETYASAPPGTPETVAWEIYRGRNRYDGAIEDGYTYELVATLGPNETSYEDTEVIRGISYFYYIQAVGPENTDPTGLTPTGVPLRSSRYYTQTFDPAFLKRSPGTTLDEVRVVPNPYNLGSDQDVRWPDQQDKIGFLNIPGRCRINIFTEIGELVETIEHTDGSGDAYWNLTTYSNQVTASGVYLAVIEDLDTGERLLRNFVIIR